MSAPRIKVWRDTSAWHWYICSDAQTSPLANCRLAGYWLTCHGYPTQAAALAAAEAAYATLAVSA